MSTTVQQSTEFAQPIPKTKNVDPTIEPLGSNIEKVRQEKFEIERELPDAVFNIICKESHKAITLTDTGFEEMSTTNGNKQHQKFYLELLRNGNFLIRVMSSGLYLDIQNSSRLPNAKIIQTPKKGGPNQQWWLDALANNCYRIVSVHSGLPLDIFQGQLVQYYFQQRKNQKFEFKSTEDKVPESIQLQQEIHANRINNLNINNNSNINIEKQNKELIDVIKHRREISNTANQQVNNYEKNKKLLKQPKFSTNMTKHEELKKIAYERRKNALEKQNKNSDEIGYNDEKQIKLTDIAIDRLENNKESNIKERKNITQQENIKSMQDKKNEKLEKISQERQENNEIEDETKEIDNNNKLTFKEIVEKKVDELQRVGKERLKVITENTNEKEKNDEDELPPRDEIEVQDID